MADLNLTVQETVSNAEAATAVVLGSLVPFTATDDTAGEVQAKWRQVRLSALLAHARGGGGGGGAPSGGWDVTIGTTAPDSPTDGQGWYDTANNQLKVYNGSAWDGVGVGELNPPPLEGDTPVSSTDEFSFVPVAAADWINDNLIELPAQRNNDDRWPLDKLATDVATDAELAAAIAAHAAHSSHSSTPANRQLPAAAGAAYDVLAWIGSARAWAALATVLAANAAANRVAIDAEKAGTRPKALHADELLNTNFTATGAADQNKDYGGLTNAGTLQFAYDGTTFTIRRIVQGPPPDGSITMIVNPAAQRTKLADLVVVIDNEELHFSHATAESESAGVGWQYVIAAPAGTVDAGTNTLQVYRKVVDADYVQEGGSAGQSYLRTATGYEWGNREPPLGVRSPIQKINGVLSLDETAQAGAQSRGTAELDAEITVSGGNIGMWITPTGGYNIPQDRELSIEVVDASSGWTQEQESFGSALRSVTAAATGTAASAITNKRKIECGDYDVYLGRTASNTLLVAASAAATFRIRVYELQGTLLSQQIQQQQAIEYAVQTFVFERWVAPGTSLAGNQGLTYNGQVWGLNGWSFVGSLPASPGAGYVKWRLVVSRSSAPGTSNGFSVQQVYLEPEDHQVFTRTQYPVSAADYISNPSPGDYVQFYSAASHSWSSPIRLGSDANQWVVLDSEWWQPRSRTATKRLDFASFGFAGYGAIAIRCEMYNGTTFLWDYRWVIDNPANGIPVNDRTDSPVGTGRRALALYWERNIGTPERYNGWSLDNFPLGTDGADRFGGAFGIELQFQRPSGVTTGDLVDSAIFFSPSTWGVAESMRCRLSIERRG